MPDFSPVVQHLIHHVLPAAEEYHRAERALSAAFESSPKAPARCAEAGRTAIRAASNVAIAIDGLTDRMHNVLGASKTQMRSLIQAKCIIGTTVREGCMNRIRGVAVVYKHQHADDPTLTVRGDENVLAVGAAYGVDGWGIGKFSGVEVLVEEVGGRKRKFMGDVPAGIRGWTEYLRDLGASLPGEMRTICGLEIHV